MISRLATSADNVGPSCRIRALIDLHNLRHRARSGASAARLPADVFGVLSTGALTGILIGLRYRRPVDTLPPR